MASAHERETLAADIMDSRDLDAIADEIQDALDAADDPDDSDRTLLDLLDVDEDEAREILAAIRELEGSGATSEWAYGAAFIREDYFTEYAQDIAKDIGAIGDDSYGWPLFHIDWEAAADALKQDYTEVEFRGTTYYVRA